MLVAKRQYSKLCPTIKTDSSSLFRKMEQSTCNHRTYIYVYGFRTWSNFQAQCSFQTVILISNAWNNTIKLHSLVRSFHPPDCRISSSSGYVDERPSTSKIPSTSNQPVETEPRCNVRGDVAILKYGRYKKFLRVKHFFRWVLLLQVLHTA